MEQIKVRVDPLGFVTRKDAGRALQRAPKTLCDWAARGYGPPPILRGSRVFYPVHVPGAKLSGGDLHFSQGDGEVTFCRWSLEDSGKVLAAHGKKGLFSTRREADHLKVLRGA